MKTDRRKGSLLIKEGLPSLNTIDDNEVLRRGGRKGEEAGAGAGRRREEEKARRELTLPGWKNETLHKGPKYIKLSPFMELCPFMVRELVLVACAENSSWAGRERRLGARHGSTISHLGT